MRNAMVILMVVLVGCAATMEEEYPPEIENYINEVSAFPLSFIISKAEEEDAWGRAHIFISRYSSMPIKIYTTATIKTEEPGKQKDQYGYQVTKTNEGGNIRIRVVCTAGKFTLEKSMVMNARILAYYMKTDLLPYPKLIKR